MEWSSRLPCAVGRFRHLLHEFREFFHVPGLDLDQLVDSVYIVGMVRNGMERIRNPDVIVGAVGAFGDHDVCGHASKVGLKRESQQVEH